jgi:hypothetical protein
MNLSTAIKSCICPVRTRPHFVSYVAILVAEVRTYGWSVCAIIYMYVYVWLVQDPRQICNQLRLIGDLELYKEHPKCQEVVSSMHVFICASYIRFVDELDCSTDANHAYTVQFNTIEL